MKTLDQKITRIWDRSKGHYVTNIQNQEVKYFDKEVLQQRKNDFIKHYSLNDGFSIKDGCIYKNGKLILDYEDNIPFVWYQQNNVKNEDKERR